MRTSQLFGPRRRRLPPGLTQLGGALAGVALGLLTPLLPAGPFIEGDRVFDLLCTVGFGVLGLVSVLFSLLFIVVQWASSSFTPRLRLFRNDPLIWQVFALATGLFTYSLTAGLAITPGAPVPAAVPAVALVALLVTLAAMRSLQVRAFESLQLAPTLAAVSSRGRQVIARAYPTSYTSSPGGRLPDTAGRCVVWGGATGVLQRLDLPDLVIAASQADARVDFTASVGDVLWHGKALAVVEGARLSDRSVTGAVELGLERSFEQDPALAFRLLADIGLRALSAAVNDPATAVQVLDSVEPLLGDVMARDLVATELRDATGRVRVTVSQPTWADLVTLSLDDLITASVGSPMVLRRLVNLLADLCTRAPSGRVDLVVARFDHVASQLAAADPFASPGALGTTAMAPPANDAGCP